MNPSKLYKKAVEKWGVEAQVDMVVEECAELILAIQKVKRKLGKAPAKKLLDVAYEIADVEIMLEQMKTILCCHGVVEMNKKVKLERLKKRLGVARSRT